MKGIIVETDKKDAVILSEEGLFKKIKNDRYQIGQAIEIKENKRIASRWIAGAASMAAALAFCTIGAFAYYTPTDYVSMDVNPSIEYSINRFDRILDAKAVNDDGKVILAQLDLKNMKLQNAMKETLDQLISDGYLTDDPNSGVVIATSNEDMNEAEKLATELEKEVRVYLDTDGIKAEVDAEAVAPDRVKEAKALGVTPGKLNLVEKLKESTSSGAITDEKQWLNKSVKEINKAIKENRKLEQEKDQDKDKGKDKEKNKNKPQGAVNGADSADLEQQTSGGGIVLTTNNLNNQEKLHPGDPGYMKGNNKNSKDGQVSDEEQDQSADQIESETQATDNTDQVDASRQNNSSRNDSKSKPDNGKSPKGDNN